MNLVELYEGTPVQEHANIRVCGDRVLVKDSQGSVEEYLLGDDDELWLVRSDREQRESLTSIKTQLGL